MSDANLSRVGQLWWGQLPLLAYRWSPTLGSALTDGIHWVHWPRPAAAAPLLALLAGAVAASIQPGPTFTSSLLTIALVALPAVAAFSLGALAWLAYGLVDALTNPWVLSRTAGLAHRWLGAPAGQLSEYLLLGVMAIATPMAVLAIRVEIRALNHGGQLNDWSERLLGVVTWAVFAYFWVASLPILIRPTFSFQGRTPDSAAVVGVQQRWWLVVALVVAAAVGRAMLERRAIGQQVLDMIQDVAAAATPPSHGPLLVPPLAQVVGAAMTTLLLGGLITNFVAGAAVLVVLFITIGVRDRIRATGACQSVAAIPLLARYGLGIVLTLAIVRVALRFAARTSVFGSMIATESFTWPLIGAVISVVAVTLLVAPLRTEPPDASGDPR